MTSCPINRNVGAVFGVSDTFLKVTWSLVVVRSTPTEFQLRLWPIFPNSTKTIKSNWLLLLSYFGSLSNENQFEITCRIFLPHPLIYLSRSRRLEDRCIIHSTLAVVVFLTSEGRLSVKKKRERSPFQFSNWKNGFPYQDTAAPWLHWGMKWAKMPRTVSRSQLRFHQWSMNLWTEMELDDVMFFVCDVNSSLCFRNGAQAVEFKRKSIRVLLPSESYW